MGDELLQALMAQDQQYAAQMDRRHGEMMSMMPGAVQADINKMNVSEAGMPTPSRALWKTLLQPKFGRAELGELIKYLPLKQAGGRADDAMSAVMRRAVDRPSSPILQRLAKQMAGETGKMSAEGMIGAGAATGGALYAAHKGRQAMKNLKSKVEGKNKQLNPYQNVSDVLDEITNRYK